MAHAPCRLSRPPRVLMNTASASSRRRQRSGASRGRPAGDSQRSTAARAGPPSGHEPLLGPLAEHPEQSVVPLEVGRGTARPPRRCGPRCRRAARGGPGRADRPARCRSPSRAAASTWLSSRALGSRRGRRGERRSAVGSASIIPSPARKRNSPRSAVVERAIDAGFRPWPRNSARWSSMTSVPAASGSTPAGAGPPLPDGDVAAVGGEGVPRPPLLHGQPGQVLLGAGRQRLAHRPALTPGLPAGRPPGAGGPVPPRGWWSHRRSSRRPPARRTWLRGTSTIA